MFIMLYISESDKQDAYVMDTDDLTCEKVSRSELSSSGLDIYNAYCFAPGLLSMKIGKFGLVERKSLNEYVIDGVAVRFVQNVEGLLLVNRMRVPVRYRELFGLDGAFRMGEHLFLLVTKLDERQLLIALDYTGRVVGWRCDDEFGGDIGLVTKGVMLCM